MGEKRGEGLVNNLGKNDGIDGTRDRGSRGVPRWVKQAKMSD